MNNEYLIYNQQKKILNGGNKLVLKNLIFFLDLSTHYDILKNFQIDNNFSKLYGKINSINDTKSSNGLIYLMQYKYENSIFNTILKISKNIKSDNVYYEYNLGLCINKYKQYFPNFIFTFTYFTIDSNFLDILKKNQKVGFNDLIQFRKNINDRENINNKIYNLNKTKIEKGCINNDRACILIENIPNVKKLKYLLNDDKFNLNLNYNIFSLLFQLYAVLYSLKDEFTHYDLHDNNVLFVKLHRLTKIIYTIDNKIYIIYTRYIPVIIDYGRSYVKCKLFDSLHFANIACDSICNKIKSKSLLKNNNADLINDCIILSSMIRKSNGQWGNPSSIAFITPNQKNISHDLRYINILMNSTLKNNQFHLKTEFIKIFNINNNNDWFIYNSIKNKYYIGYGTVEKKSEPGKINNIIDLMKFLIKYYDTELENYLQSFPISSTKIYDTIQINCDID